MTSTFTSPVSARTSSNSRERTRTALFSILTKLGGHEFAETYVDDFTHYVFSGDLTNALRELRGAGDDTYHKVIRVVSEAQAEAIAKVVPEARPRSAWFWNLVPWPSRQRAGTSKSVEARETMEAIAR